MRQRLQTSDRLLSSEAIFSVQSCLILEYSKDLLCLSKISSKKQGPDMRTSALKDGKPVELKKG